MRIRLLGPVELRVGADGFDGVAGAQRRAVLALLALRLGRLVTMEQLCEMLWDEQPPPSARAAVQGHVAALRKVLADTPFELHTRDSGYLLDGPVGAVDALRFEELAAAADRQAWLGNRTAAVALLEEALGLWRGEALADLPDTPLRAAAVDRLEQSRTSVLVRWADLRLGQGTGASAVPLLEQGVRVDGLREELVALLMRCLHQAGRPAEALTAYHRARVRLADELGINPGPALRAALAEVLADDRAAERPPVAPPAAEPAPPTPQAPPAPRQLPRRDPDFVGRLADLARLDRACGPDRSGEGPVLVVGPAGVGKSALVTAWAHRAAGRFPDGVLHAELHGLAPSDPNTPGSPNAPEAPARPEAVLAGFLRALGVPEEDIPADRAARAALYRERTRGRRLLVLLDDAADAEQVADLLPAGPTGTAVVTGRGPLEGLVALEGAGLLRLAALPEDDALHLLERALTPERLRAEPEAAARLAGLCDHLPLALRIAAARLAARPDWTVAGLVAELADERTRLAVLDADGTLSVADRLRLTHRRLSEPAAELLTALAAHPGREVDAQASAALLGSDTATAHRALGELATHHLLTGTAPGRHARTDLVRLYGTGLLAERPEQHRRLLRERLADHYLTALRHCGSFLDPGQEDTAPPAAAPSAPAQAVPAAVDIRTALDWFDAEEPAISALVASPDTDPARAWRLALTCGSLYYGASRFTDWLAGARLGQAAAERCGDPVAVALLLTCRAQALVALERRPESAEAARRAVAAVESATGPAAASARVRALATLALVTAMLGHRAEAERLAASATALALESGDRRRLVDAKVHQGWVSLAVGDREGAQRRSREARELLPATPVTQVHLWSLLTEAQALPPTVRDDAADLAWHRLLAACEEAGLLYLHAVTEQAYATHLTARGREPEAGGRLRRALARFRAHDRQAGYLSEFTTGLEESLDLRAGRRPAHD